MPIEVRRFGIGHRRPDGPPGSVNTTGQLIHSDGRGTVAELAFGRGARIEPHTNPDTAYFVVIEGGGWVAVGDERLRIAAGEAVVWPAGVVHAAWTDHTEMRAIVVEFSGSDDTAARGVLEGTARELPPGAGRTSPGEGRLQPPRREVPADPTAGEPA